MLTTPENASLDKASFKKLSPPPFNKTIQASQAVIWHDGYVYLGAARGPIRGRGGRAGGHDLGAEIARYDPKSQTWQQVYKTPQESDGNARDRSIHAFVVQNDAAGKPVLYAAASGLRGQVTLLRFDDAADHFVDCGLPGLGQGGADIAGLCNICAHEGQVFTSPLGLNKGNGWADDSEAAIAAVLATTDPAGDSWDIISAPNFDDADNLSISALCVLNGKLYAATLNRKSGFQLWRSDALPAQGKTKWTKLLDRGGFRGPASPFVASMAVFDGALYVGTGARPQPKDPFGPHAAELIRVNADDSWDLIAGENRLTPDGLKRPLSGQGPGFDDPFVQAFWRMAVHEGKLYVGGRDWRAAPTYLPRNGRSELSPITTEWLQLETEGWSGDFGLWGGDGKASWRCITATGLGDNPKQFGIGGMVSTPHGLFVVPTASGAEAGVEVWQAATTKPPMPRRPDL
ncbi:MAG: hypothetical protein JKX69_04310 [Rhodobacteraceae bacterium]|nr:hypothetical protein [Paracoccaceae bacterium]